MTASSHFSRTRISARTDKEREIYSKFARQAMRAGDFKILAAHYEAMVAHCRAAGLRSCTYVEFRELIRQRWSRHAQTWYAAGPTSSTLASRSFSTSTDEVLEELSRAGSIDVGVKY